jgi:conjugative transfer pilus assembly protein TraH
MTSIPLYKIMTVNVAAQFGMGRSEMDFIAEAVAYDMLISYTDVMLAEVRRNQTSYQAVASNEFESWRNSVSEVRTELAQRSERIQGRLNYTYQIIERTQMLETSLRNAMTPGMAASLRFGRGLSAQGLRQ